MRVSVTEAKGQLTELVKRAEAGDEVILTRRGHEVVRLVAMAAAPGLKGRRALMEKVRAAAASKGKSCSRRIIRITMSFRRRPGRTMKDSTGRRSSTDAC